MSGSSEHNRGKLKFYSAVKIWLSETRDLPSAFTEIANFNDCIHSFRDNWTVHVYFRLEFTQDLNISVVT